MAFRGRPASCLCFVAGCPLHRTQTLQEERSDLPSPDHNVVTMLCIDLEFVNSSRMEFSHPRNYVYMPAQCRSPLMLRSFASSRVPTAVSADAMRERGDAVHSSNFPGFYTLQGDALHLIKQAWHVLQRGNESSYHETLASKWSPSRSVYAQSSRTPLTRQRASFRGEITDMYVFHNSRHIDGQG